MNAGIVSIRPLSEAQSQIMLEMEYDAQGVVERAGDATGLVTQRVQGDLERFKTFIESRGRETGAWRGTVK